MPCSPGASRCRRSASSAATTAYHWPAPSASAGAKTPAASTLSDLFAALDPAALDAALRVWLASRGPDTGHLALDGKTARGSDGHAPAAHRLAAYATEHAAVVGQLRVAVTTNEHKAALRLLGVLPRTGWVVTADAVFCHRDVCDTITDAGGDDLLAVKDNQELLADDLAAVFAGGANLPPQPTDRRAAEEQSASSLDKGHGRVERRSIRTTTALNEYRADWPKLAQVARVERVRRANGGESVEVAYVITRLGRDRADAARLLHLTRAHWHIENRLHHVRDATMGEDRSRVRTGSSPEVLSALRNTVVHLLETVPARSKAAASQRLAAHPDEAIRLILTGLHSPNSPA